LGVSCGLIFCLRSGGSSGSSGVSGKWACFSPLLLQNYRFMFLCLPNRLCTSFSILFGRDSFCVPFFSSTFFVSPSFHFFIRSPLLSTPTPLFVKPLEIPYTVPLSPIPCEGLFPSNPYIQLFWAILPFLSCSRPWFLFLFGPIPFVSVTSFFLSRRRFFPSILPRFVFSPPFWFFPLACPNLPLRTILDT